jgi:hypothetical protein
MATRRYTGTIVDIHYDDRRGHATVTLELDRSGDVVTFNTNRRATAIHIESFFAVGDTGYISADPNTLLIDGYGK